MTAPKKQQRRKITSEDIDAIAALIVRRRLTEAEACLSLGIHPPSWYNWKLKPHNQVKNAESLSRVRAAWVESRCKSIEEVGDGAPGTRRDWRAQAWMLERTLPERFGSQPPKPEDTRPAASGVTVNVWLREARAQIAQEAGQVVDCEELKALPPAAPNAVAFHDGPGREVWSDSAPAKPETSLPVEPPETEQGAKSA